MRLFFLLSSLILLAGTYARAARMDAKFTPISTFQDDRGVKVVNDNFKRLGLFIVDVASFNFSVGAAFTVTTVTFAAPQANTDYGVFITPSWDANARVLFKTTTGFMIHHEVPGAGKTMDFMTVR